jgi:hypothetical protein
VVALISLFVALGGTAAASGSGGPQATASASVKKTVKKLKKTVSAQQEQLAAFEQQLAGLEGAPGPPSGSAGGDLAGSYPNPFIAGSAIGSAEVANNSLGAADVNESGLDSSVLQRRISTACPGGQAIESVGATGTPSCTTLGGPPSGPAGGDLAGGTDYPNPTIANDAVNAAKIQNGQVGDPEIATDAVRTAEILDAEVGVLDIGNNAVSAAEITNGQVGEPEIATDAVRTAEIQDGQVGTADQAVIPAALVGRGSAQSIPSGNQTKIAFDDESQTELYDTANLHDTVTLNTRLTAPVAGLYYVHGQIEWAADPDDDEQLQQLQIRRSNNALLAEDDLDRNEGPGTPAQEVSTVVSLNATEALELLVFQDNTDNDSLDVRQLSQTWPTFGMTWLGPPAP